MGRSGVYCIFYSEPAHKEDGRRERERDNARQKQNFLHWLPIKL